MEATASEIVDAAIHVHRALGPGLLESAYQHCIAHELRKRGYHVECEVILPVVSDGVQIDAGFRIDMVVNGCVIIENKAVQKIAPIHEAQLITYLKLGDFKIGFLLNWNVKLIKDGIRRFVHQL